MKKLKPKQKVDRNYVKGFSLALMITTAFFIGTIVTGTETLAITQFESDCSQADVGESILFTWSITREDYDSAWISFGDGNQTVITGIEGTVKHKFSYEGRYNISIFVFKNILNEVLSDSTSLMMTIQNYAPMFNFSLPTWAHEDEKVNVNVPLNQIIDSDVDKEPGKFTYLYDFADGNQTTSTQNSILHAWKDQGIYPVSITIIDDQGALSKEFEEINIINKPPSSFIDIDSDIPAEELITSYYATHDFRNDEIGTTPSGWEVEQSSNPAPQTAIIRPDEDITNQWYPSDVYHWNRIDESEPDGSRIFETKDGDIDEFGFENILNGDKRIITLTFHLYGKKEGLFSDLYCKWRLGSGSYYSSKYPSFNFDGTYSWKTVSWDCDLSTQELNDLRFAMEFSRHPEFYSGDDEVLIDTLYCEVTYAEDVSKLAPNDFVYHVNHWESGSYTPLECVESEGGGFIKTSSDNKKEEFEFEDIQIYDIKITKVKFQLRGKMDGITPFIKCRWNIGTYYSDIQYAFFSSSYSWDILSWDCDLTYEQLNDIVFEIESWQHPNYPLPPLEEYGDAYIDQIYLEFTYKDDLEISVIDAGDDYLNVVELDDGSDYQNIWMDSNFTGQEYGTIEFYVKSSNTDIKTWGLSLWDDDTMAFEVFMDEGKWKFKERSNIYTIVTGPSSYTWYHVSLDFCATGTYEGLTEDEFQISIDGGATTIPLPTQSISNISKIRIQTDVDNKGTAWVDALGISWDPDYNIGENNYLLIGYPEKCEIKFSAESSTDTVSDQDALRYYWDFGDSTSGYGKIVEHEYFSSGNYYVTLTSKDDNGDKDSFGRRILVHNKKPEISLISPEEMTTIDEGQTLLFEASTIDDSTDLTRLQYWWNFENGEVDPNDLGSSELGGWQKSHLFTDDYFGTSCVFVKDPEGYSDLDYRYINVRNVNPQLSIYDATILANITFEVYRNDTLKDSNFTFNILGNDMVYFSKMLNFSETTESSIFYQFSDIPMSLSKNWKVMVDSSDLLPQDSQFRYQVKLNFLNGDELELSSPQLMGSQLGYWEEFLNPYWYDNFNHDFNYPITYSASVWDPSIDNIDISVNYTIDMLLEITCNDELPLTDDFTISYSLGDAEYTISIFENDSKKWVNISVLQEVFTNTYTDNDFPVNLDVPFRIDPLIDLYDLLVSRVGLEDFSIVNCVKANHALDVLTKDDDEGENKSHFGFNTLSDIEFEGFASKLTAYIPQEASEGEIVSFFLEVFNFDIVDNVQNFSNIIFQGEDVPDLPSDITLINGSCDWLGDLNQIDNDYTTIIADSDIYVPDQPNDFDINTGSSNWAGDLYSMDNDYTTFYGDTAFGSTYTNNIIPDGDVYTNWNEGSGAPHFSKLDESNPDGVVIKETGTEAGILDRQNYGTFTIQSGYYVTGVKVHIYGKVDSMASSYGKVRVNIGGWTSQKSMSLSWNSYSWKTFTWTGLQKTQTDLNNLQVDLYCYNVDEGLFFYYEGRTYIDSVYVEVICQEIINEMDVEAKVNLNNDVNLDDIHLSYSYKTIGTVQMQFKIWNYDTQQWNIIDSNNYDSFSEHSFQLNSAHYDENFDLKLLFYTTHSTYDIELLVDMLEITKGNHSIELIADFHIVNPYNGELLTDVSLTQGCSAEGSQLATFSLFNFRTQIWDTFDAYELGSELYSKKTPIQSADYYSSSMDLRVKVEANNKKLFIDQLQLEYCWINYSIEVQPYLHEIPEQPSEFSILKGNSDFTGDLDQSDQDYTTFNSTDNELEVIIDLTLEDCSNISRLISLDLLYSYQTTIDQLINISLYNFLTEQWSEISSCSKQIFSSEHYSISTEWGHYHNSTFHLLVKLEGYNETNDFQLKLDQFKIHYQKLDYMLDATCYAYFNSTSLATYYESLLTTLESSGFASITSFSNEAEYLFSFLLDNGFGLSYTGGIVDVSAPQLSAKIGYFSNNTEEDSMVSFTSEINIVGSNETDEDVMIMWSFGDGTYSYEKNPKHAYAEDGIYTISLVCLDPYGNKYFDIANITVEDKKPEIVGPFTFYGVEGQGLVMDVEIHDTFLDETQMSYTWKEGAEIVSLDKKPVIFFENGEYLYTLEVQDIKGQVSFANISIFIDDLPPMVKSSSYMYYGAPSPLIEGFTTNSEEPGTVQLTAYGYDTSYDIQDLRFNWTITRDYKTYNTFDINPGNDNNSTVYFRVKHTTIYYGTVSVIDNHNLKSTASFTISPLIDSNANGYSDEFEAMLAQSGKNLSIYQDTDDDGLINAYETMYSKTDPYDSDTDDDGLLDGINKTTGIGELSFYSDPNCTDTDGDGLDDYFEVFGWNMTSEIYGEITVNSNPVRFDTDRDGLSDYSEFQTKTNPQNSDTDSDGLNDLIDPFPNKMDGDDDGLKDGYEMELGTSFNMSDTDGDGLTDGQEVLGWGYYTNPLSADSDHDFLSDGAETKNYKFKLANRYSLNQSRSLWFEERCTKAAAAQIAITIAFGEADPAHMYGVLDVPNLTVTLHKVDDNLIIFSETTNKSRYFSKIIDIREIIENRSLDYYGEYVVSVDNTEAGCLLEQFEIEIAKYLDPNDPDFDGDGIMDGVEAGLLVSGTDKIDYKDTFGEYPITFESTTYPLPKLEVGSIILGNTIDKGDSHLISFSNQYTNPVVVAYIMSRGGGQSVDVRVKDVTSSNCTIFMEENDNEGHNDETVGYIVIEAGSWVLEDGLKIEAGIITTDNNHNNGDEFGGVLIDFEQSFSSTPVVLHCLNSYNNGEFKSSIAHMNSNSSFILQQESGRSEIATSSETIAWIAVESGKSGTINGIMYETGSSNDGTADGEDDTPHIISYSQSFSSTPIIIVKQNSANDPNYHGSYARGQGTHTITTHKVYAEEDQINDGGERNHPDETFGYWVFESAFYSEKTEYAINDTEIHEFYNIEIPFVGEVNDANITLQFKTNNLPYGSGNVTISLVKEEIDNHLQNFVFFEFFDIFNQDNVLFDKFIDLTEYVANDSISDYHGKYHLTITIIDSNNTHDSFLLTDFHIESDTFIEAGMYDTEAWITDPAKADTDEDGWTDYYEIYERSQPTNPLSEDTDGDGVIDSNDLDPLRDLIIEISPIYGWHRNLGFWDRTPLLEIVVSFESNGIQNYFCSEMRMATHDLESIKKLFITRKHYRKAFFDGRSGGDPLHYYANVDDDIKANGGKIGLNIQLWKMSQVNFLGITLWDKIIINSEVDYTIGDATNLEVQEVGDSGNLNYAQIKVETKALEKANTIVIYENGTVFNGHYQQQERMNIIQLYVNDDTPLTGTPFVEGPNIIVIPTSLFTETILNAKIQNDQLNETALYSEGQCEFISIDRDSETEEACGDVDFVLVRFDINAVDAMEVLDLILSCLVNETTNETASVYCYASTKEHSFDAVLMNLPNAALGYVLWLFNYENSPQGRTPRGFRDWLGDTFNKLKNFIVGIFIAIWESMVTLWNAIVEYVEDVLMNKLPWLGYVLWLLVRAALLIIAYVLLAITIIGLLIGLAAFTLLGIVISSFNGSFPNIGFLFVEFNMFGFNLRYEIQLEWLYIDFFDLHLPYVFMNLTLNEIVFCEMKMGLVFESQNSNLIPASSNIPEEPPIPEPPIPEPPIPELPKPASPNEEGLFDFSWERLSEFNFDFAVRVKYYGDSPPIDDYPYMDIASGPNDALSVDEDEHIFELEHFSDNTYYFKKVIRLEKEAYYRFNIFMECENGVSDNLLNQTGPLVVDATSISKGMTIASAFNIISIASLLVMKKRDASAACIFIPLLITIAGLVTTEVMASQEEEPYDSWFGLGSGIIHIISAVFLFVAFLKKSMTWTEATSTSAFTLETVVSTIILIFGLVVDGADKAYLRNIFCGLFDLINIGFILLSSFLTIGVLYSDGGATHSEHTPVAILTDFLFLAVSGLVFTIMSIIGLCQYNK